MEESVGGDSELKSIGWRENKDRLWLQGRSEWRRLEETRPGGRGWCVLCGELESEEQGGLSGCRSTIP